MIRILSLLFLLTSSAVYSQSEGWAICNSGANLYFKMVGSGEPILVVSDAGSSSTYLKDLILRLAENHKVIYFDARATGKSKLPVIHDSTVNFNKAVEDIEGLRAVLRIPKWTILAHGFGAMIASVYAGKYTQNVQRLLLINPDLVSKKPLHYDPYTDTYEDYDFSPQLKESIISQRFDTMMQTLTTKINPRDTLGRWQIINQFQAAAYVHDTINEPLAFSYLQERVRNIAIKKRLREAWNPQFLGMVRKFQNPVLVILSKKRHSYIDVSKSWKDSLPNCRIVSIEKAYHFPWVDNPIFFYEEIKPFLGRNLITSSNGSKKKINRSVGGGYQRRKRA